jgi:hypothetical protein
VKKLIQIALVLILVCVLFQTAADGSMTGSNSVSGTPLTEETNEANIHATACLVGIKGVICVTPYVGWNT